MRQLREAVLYDFDVHGRRVRFWKRSGESLEHIVLKALGYSMFVREYPNIVIEHDVELRYKPDLVAMDEAGRFSFWGECGTVTIKKIAWLLKHAGIERLVVFKFYHAEMFAVELRREINAKYRQPGRITVINFNQQLLDDLPREISNIPASWFVEIKI